MPVPHSRAPSHTGGEPWDEQEMLCAMLRLDWGRVCQSWVHFGGDIWHLCPVPLPQGQRSQLSPEPVMLHRH